jgi:stearoyl-CoA desaturase (delta-9 desaturase)
LWRIKSFSHIFGQTEFESQDHSKNLMWASMPSFGSGFQNNQHTFPTSAYLELQLWQVDFGTWTIILLGASKLAWDIKFPTEMQMDAKRIKVPVCRRISGVIGVLVSRTPGKTKGLNVPKL